MAANQQFCLRWNNHQSTLISVFDNLLESGTLVDCTLAADGQFLKAHKVVLSACSPYLEALLSQHYEKHPILILKDVTFHELKSMLDYMYRGEVNISQEQLGTFLKAAESLQIKGLTDCGGGGVSDARDLDRVRELERAREIDRFRELERVASATKRLEIRKQVPIVPRQRSPPLLPQNLNLTIEHRRSNKHTLGHDFITNNPNLVSSREGSVSPSAKRKRQSKQSPSQSDEPNLVSTPSENQHDNKTEIKSLNDNQVTTPPATTPTTSNVVTNSKKPQSPVVQNEQPIENETIKQEFKSEPRTDYSEDIQNDDSVEDLTMEEEEEDMDEMSELDLSRPGPSNAANSHSAGFPSWHIGDNSAEEMLLAGQQDSQGSERLEKLQTVKLKYPFSCECGKSYTLRTSLRNHKMFDCGKKPEFECPCCNYCANRKGNLKIHFFGKHGDKITQWPY
uniref:BTB domain-containing protein n=1 Tax=Clastoptera arizonana TaxID=38151 RepID=A0A1B6DHJ4_9HEMI